MSILLDKISAVTKNLHLDPIMEVTGDIICEQGAVLAAEVLHDKTIYNDLELSSGRVSRLKKHDVIAVALGSRMALKGFVGEIPQSLCIEDEIHLLNQGGVAGECISSNVAEVGQPLRLRVLGAIVRNGKNLNIDQAKIFEPAIYIDNEAPLVVISGTSMDSGKTTVAAEIIKTFHRFGLKLGGAKLTGVGALRDIYKMTDFGVHQAVSFLDAGIASTANLPEETVIGVAKGAINHLAKQTPDAIIIEFGDGVLGRYGVRSILSDSDIQKNVKLHIGCASDPAGALKLAEECKAIGLPLGLMSGPITDNLVGQSIIEEEICIPSFNAFNPDNEQLVKVLAKWNDSESQ
jgi:hypothetical protein